MKGRDRVKGTRSIGGHENGCSYFISSGKMEFRQSRRRRRRINMRGFIRVGSENRAEFDYFLVKEV